MCHTLLKLIIGLMSQVPEGRMTTLSAETQRFVLEQRLGYHATVSPDGMPCLAHAGTTSVYDDEHLFFADIRSRGPWRTCA